MMTGTASAQKNIEDLLLDGLLPSEIGQRLGLPVNSVIRDIRTKVGEGVIRFSDVYFALAKEKRDVRERLVETHEKLPIKEEIRAHGFAPEDIDFYESIRWRHVFAGDLYEDISETELALHDMIFAVLTKEYGAHEGGYWRKGVPLLVRQRCHARREEDDQPADSPFRYTMILDLAAIIDKNWQLFGPRLPKKYAQGKTLRSDLARLNEIRNEVMHPVKRRYWSADDFNFARTMRDTFSNYRKKKANARTSL